MDALHLTTYIIMLAISIDKIDEVFLGKKWLSVSI